MEVGPPVIQVSVTTVTNSKRALESPARWRPWSVPHSKWSKRRRAVYSNTRCHWMSRDSPKLTVPVSPPPYPITLSSLCPAWYAVAPEPPASTSLLNASITETALKFLAPMKMMKTRRVLLLCLVSAAPALTESPDQASPSPKTTCRQICPHTLNNPREVRWSIQHRRGSHWTGRRRTPWLGTPSSICMIRRACGVTPAWPVEECSMMWHLMWECRLNKYRDIKPPQLS